MRGRLLTAVVLAAGCTSETGLTPQQFVVVDGVAGNVETPLAYDQVVQVTIPKTDVLFVVDNSCSMEDEQLLLGTNFPVFMEWFQGSGLDFHIGVVSTDMNDPLQAGRLRSINGQRWVQETTESPELIFSAMAVMGVDGHWIEQGRAAAYTAVEVLAPTENAGFIRPDAGLHIAVVSDEDDESGGSPVSRQEFVDYLVNARPTRQMVSFSSIVGPSTGCESALEPGSDYLAITTAVGGVSWSICSERWDGVLDELGFVAVGLQREFFLSEAPVEGTVQVTTDFEGVVTAFDEGVDWAYNPQRNSINFIEYMPQPRELIQMEYRLLSALEDDVRNDVTEIVD